MACALSHANLFDDMPRQITIVDGAYEEILPINSIDTVNPRLEFLVKGMKGLSIYKIAT